MVACYGATIQGGAQATTPILQRMVFVHEAVLSLLLCEAEHAAFPDSGVT